MGDSHEKAGQGWAPEVDQLRRREELARGMGGAENVARQRAAGRLTVRERIDLLVDPGSFHETGTLAGAPTYQDGELVDLLASNFILGTGRVEGRRVVVGGDDFTIRGGAADAAIGAKAPYAERMALELRLPMVRLVDGTGGGGSVKYLETHGRTYVPYNPAMETMVPLLETVPVASAALGPVAGLGAARVVFSHFSVMPKETAQVFVAGPPVVEPAFGRNVGKEELGGHRIHARGSGVVDNEAASEADALAQVRRFLSYMPSSVYEMPPVVACSDPAERREEELLSIIPRDRRRHFPVRQIIEMVLDQGSFFEMGARQGRSAVVGLARLQGRPVGVMANDPKWLGGALDARASEKFTRFIDMCDTFHLPVINFVDLPGFLIGVDSERQGTIRTGARWIYSVYQARVPWCSVILRRAFGVAGAAHGNHSRLNLRFAWPSGEWGSLPLRGGVQAAYKRQIEAASDPDALRSEIEAKLEEFTSPLRTAEAFGIEEIIDPRDTRPLLCEWLETAWRLLPSQLGPTRRGMRP
jgi:acetyl-CoA carboxylase carboxyltransferase component